MTEDEVLARSDANYYEVWRLLAANAADGEAWEKDGLVITATGSPYAWLNVAFVTRPLRDPERRLREAVAYFDGRRLPFMARLRDGVDPQTEHVLDSMGLPCIDSVPGMAIAPLGGCREAAPAVEIKRVDDDQGFAEFVSIIGEGFQIEPGHCRRMMSPKLLDVPDARWYLGFVDGKPAAVSALIMTHRVAGVHFVATREAYRRRGLGEAVTRHAVREGAAAGCLGASLQASEMGRPVYERIGFRTVAGYRTFLRRERPD